MEMLSLYCTVKQFLTRSCKISQKFQQEVKTLCLPLVSYLFNAYWANRAHYLLLHDVDNRLPDNELLVQRDFCSKRKQRTSDQRTLTEARCAPPYSSEIHSIHQRSSTANGTTQRLAYFISDDVAQCTIQASLNLESVLDMMFDELDPQPKGVTVISDGASSQYLKPHPVLMASTQMVGDPMDTAKCVDAV